MAWLTTSGAEHRLESPETTVGSGADDTWRLSGLELNARHFVVTRGQDGTRICPGTVDFVVAVNGQQIAASGVPLQDGDTIDAGTARFVYGEERSGAFPAIQLPSSHLRNARTGVVYPVATTSVGIGRDPTNDVVLRDPTSSRFHAELRCEAGGRVLYPQGSAGTTVNGVRVGTPIRIEPGDRIGIGSEELELVAGDPPRDAPRPATAPDDDTGQRPTLTGGDASEIPRVGASLSGVWFWILAIVVIAVTIYLARG